MKELGTRERIIFWAALLKLGTLVAAPLLFSWFISTSSRQFGLLDVFASANDVIPMGIRVVLGLLPEVGFAYLLYWESKSLVWGLFGLVFGISGTVLYYVQRLVIQKKIN